MVRISFALLLLFFTAAPALAAAPPERGLSAAFNHPGFIVGQDEGGLSLPLTIRNIGLEDDSFVVTIIEKPEGWSADIRSFASLVTGQFVPGLSEAPLTLIASPPEGRPLAAGDYVFAVRVGSLDGVLAKESRATVTVRPRAGVPAPLTLASSYPQVRGPSDGRFSFSLDLRNSGAEDALIGLSAAAPDGWELYFKPSYEDKQISSIQIPKGQSRSLVLDVRPAAGAGAGVFPIRVRAESGQGTAETGLTVELTGTYKIKLFPANELLSAATEPGRPVAMNFFVMNEGSALQRQVRLLPLAPDNWKVEIKPEVIADLAEGRTPAQVTLTVTPPDNALIGDYGLGLVAEGERAKSSLDLRLTLKARAVWAWLGAGLIVLVVAALALAFRRLGRR
ncbi:NEW3 domain-containing protein [Deltaproteobacteria bacterium OttesenSCG-928-K17]|nr:NEW3 domain-containing protein [Deltaproteobacteria bacterium OttesenSCG-928-K17]